MNCYANWNVPGFASIMSLEHFARLRPSFDVVALTSGGYDPVHPGHISSIIQTSQILHERLRDASCAYGKVVVAVNGDSFLQRKKGRAFMDLQTRCTIVAAIRGVDIVIPFESDDDTMIQVIREACPTIFTKGGDRTDRHNIPEWRMCEEVDCEIITGVGLAKQWSSSNFLKDWENYVKGYSEDVSMPW